MDGHDESGGAVGSGSGFAFDAFDGERVLDADGRAVGEPPGLDADTLRGIYRDMRLSRRLDERLVSLQRQGRVGTYAPIAGQEAASVASTYALAPDDWIAYQYREHGAVAARGLPHEYLLYWMGHEVGNAALVDRNVAPLNITIADHVPHAVGLAWAAKLKGDDVVVVCHLGDGATSEGDFHEAANFAGVFDVPVVLVVNNNGWAISTPAERQTASRTFAAKAEAYGFPGVRVDGMDPLATYRVVADAAARARDADGEAPRPTLVEAVSYRFGAHTTADDPGAYRADAEVDRWRAYDPVPRFEAHLRARGVLTDDAVDRVEADVEERIADLIDAAEAYEPTPESMFDHAYAELPPEVERQRAAFADLRERAGDDSFLRES
jgi:pyruvate dehydrogenase E1 component alpha subunit